MLVILINKYNYIELSNTSFDVKKYIKLTNNTDKTDFFKR